MKKEMSVKTEKGVMSACCILAALLATLVLHCRFEIYNDGFPDSGLLNILNKLCSCFYGPDYTDLLTLSAIYLLLRYVLQKDEKADILSLVVSLVMSATLVASISFKKFNSADMLFRNKFQILMFLVCTAGFWVIIYSVFRLVYHLLGKSAAARNEPCGKSFLHDHFSLIGFSVILLGWLPWILMNYPGTGCPDGLLQLQQFLGDSDWSVGHVPLSTCIMGSLFALGRWIADANFGFFLYCLFQTLAGAWIFSYSMKKLLNLGVPAKWCMLGIAFFAFTPLWGTYAQWVEKDLLYTEIAVLQTCCMMEIFCKKSCSLKNGIFLALSSLGTVFLRNNGILAVIPAMLLLAIWLKKTDRRRVLAITLLVFVAYGGVMKVLFPLLNIQGISTVDSLSIPLQQTARYVCTHTEEITDEEKQVLEETFIYDRIFSYDPVISDPIRVIWRGQDLRAYFKIWFEMSLKHPGTYMAAFLNQAYGYLAPVSQNIEGWISQQYTYNYMQELGLYHVFDIKYSNILVQLWNLSMLMPLVKYLCTPGMYTWIVILLTVMLIKHKKAGGLILLVPSYMTILMCLASPLADAIRYELSTVASVPLLIGWTWVLIAHSPDLALKAE